MKRKRQKKEAVFTVFFIILLVVQTGCAAKDETALPDGLFVQEDRIVTADAEIGAAETEEGTRQPQEENKTTADVSVITSSGEASENAAVQESDEPVYVYIHICGEVQNPGVYRMSQGSRIYEAVEQAGGLLDSAEETAVNQALVVEDGMKVWIPPKEEIEADGSGRAVDAEKRQNKALSGKQANAGSSQAKSTDVYITVGAEQAGSTLEADCFLGDSCVNINTATESELCTLTGIGESRAKSIIQYRNEHGNFQKIEDIMKVTGIKDGAFAKIKDEIVVD